MLLSVVCGSVGLYEVDLALNAEERAAYEAEGIAAIERLAAEVRYSPRLFIGRG